MTDEAVDLPALSSYLSEELDEDVVGVEVLHDGLNLSLAISTAMEEDAYVLRRPNKFRDTESFISLEREYDVLHRLRDTALSAPEPILICENRSVIGDPFLLTTYLGGEVVPLGSDLPERFRNPDARRRIGTLLIDTLAALHSVDTGPFTHVCERRTPQDQVDEATARLVQATQATGHEPPGIWDVADWLRRNVPTESETTLCHGDFRPGNILFAGTNRPAIAGVLDWETAFLGDPLTELGYLLLRWRDADDPTPPLDGIEERYPNEDVRTKLTGDTAPGLAPFTNRPGSPDRRELVSRYEEQTDLSFENERFYRTLSAFMLAAVWEDIYRHQRESGTESDWELRIDYMSMRAKRIATGSAHL
ncbi:phosphotransferase family protein [Natronosalvus vescus]|uniref:phosphotransferase family protein n=1 Tax=Natronosalvus vescus TaxID=2953881 RepID=UPI00209173B2|nr:phosphotransferase family protein [Natronosalvus vescus]